MNFYYSVIKIWAKQKSLSCLLINFGTHCIYMYIITGQKKKHFRSVKTNERTHNSFRRNTLLSVEGKTIADFQHKYFSNVLVE